jgi:hypothetical protein
MSDKGNLFDGICDEIHEIADALVAEGHKFGAKLKAIASQITGDVPVLESEVAKDAADVVHTAETQGVEPAAKEAVADAAALGAEAVHDVESAATAPAQTAAVIAGEAAVASEPGA